MLDANQHQGKFGEDYVRVLASAAGLIVLKDDLDTDGIDRIPCYWSIRTGAITHYRSPDQDVVGAFRLVRLPDLSRT
jgi:hypothetical protein